jgi:hypothetical protein
MSRSDDQGLLILNENGGGRSTRPKSLIQAISEIEQFSVAEMNSEIPEGSLPIKTALSFFDVGLKSGLFSGLMTAVTTPLMMAAGQKLIPVFGEYEPSLFNQIFSLALAISFPICFGIFLFMSMTKSYAGNITKRAIDYLCGGVASGTIIKTVLFVLLFHYICFQILDADKVIDALRWINGLLYMEYLNLNYQKIFDWIMEFKLILIPSSYFMTFVNGVFVVMALLALVIGRYRTKVRKEFLKEWE